MHLYRFDFIGGCCANQTSSTVDASLIDTAKARFPMWPYAYYSTVYDGEAGHDRDPGFDDCTSNAQPNQMGSNLGGVLYIYIW